MRGLLQKLKGYHALDEVTNSGRKDRNVAKPPHGWIQMRTVVRMSGEGRGGDRCPVRREAGEDEAVRRGKGSMTGGEDVSHDGN